jgi:hypothetical protein
MSLTAGRVGRDPRQIPATELIRAGIEGAPLLKEVAVSIRFFRRVRIVPGLRVSLSKSGASISIGRCGAWYTVGPPGRRISVGVPGTGLFWVQQTPPARASREPSIFFVLVLTAIATALAIYVNAS